MKHHRNKHKFQDSKLFASPGSLAYVGESISSKPILHWCQYNTEFQVCQTIKDSKSCTLSSSTSNWLDVNGLHDIAVCEAVGKSFHLHNLVLESVLNTLTKPRIESFDNCIFILMKGLEFNENTLELCQEHLGFVLGKNFLISFQEQNQNDNFHSILHRIQQSVGKTRSNKEDYLLYCLMDHVVDQYYVALEKIAATIEELEEDIIREPLPQHQQKIYSLKRLLSSFKRLVLPVREMINALLHEDESLVGNIATLYFKDLQDHTKQINSNLEGQLETIDGLMNLYTNQLSQKMNTIMKTLTVFTALFMPLSFVAGIYGMNFEHMPELKTANGYFVTLGSMLLLSAALMVYFKWKKYI